MTSVLVQDFLQDSANRLPNKPALICDDKYFTYGELDASANRLANTLLDCGLQRGVHVVIWLPNTIEAVIAIFAVLKAGATFVVINQSTKPGKIIYILQNCEASALITDTHRGSTLEGFANDIPSLRHVILCGKTADEHAARHNNWQTFDSIQASAAANRPSIKTIDRDLACLIYTSGSTGEPKGVMSDHSNVVFATDSIITYIENVEDDVVCSVLPLSFDYGLYQLLMVFRFGGTLLLENGFTFPAVVLKKLELEKVTGFPIVPTMMAMLLQMDLERYDLSALRYITNTSAALPPSHIKAFSERFPNTTIYSMYGLTETKRTLYLPPDQLEKRPDSVGIAIPGTEVWLEDDDGNRLGPGIVGELVIRGGHVMRGYWGAPEATAERYRPGELPGERVCYSGDLFRMDEEGYYYFVARKDDIIKSRGEKVSPQEIENVVYQLHGVVEAAVVGVDDAILGQAIKLFVVCKTDALDKTAIIAHCRQHLEDYMIPQLVEFRSELPKTSSGKISKQELT